MGNLTTDTFTIPPTVDYQDLAKHDEKVCVVSIIGKSGFNPHYSKASIINPVVQKHIFSGHVFNANSKEDDKTDPCQMTGHYDIQNRVVYLNLQTVYDAATLAQICKDALQQETQNDSLSFWQNTEYIHARALLYLFSVSHIIVISHPGSAFDISYIRLFRLLDNMRQKFQPHMSDILHGVGVSKDWVYYARFCPPRVLFVFEINNLDPVPTEVDSAGKIRMVKMPPLKRLQHAIEDQIYRILRKTRIITNISNNSLFAVPANQEFVFVCASRSCKSSPLDVYMSHLARSCSSETETNRSRGYQANRSRTSTQNISNGTAAPKRPSETTAAGDHHNFKAFLWQHISLALSKGFDDNVGRNPAPPVFELPLVSTWFEVCRRMYDFFLVDHQGRERQYFNTLRSLLEIDTRFSESRCSKVLPQAERAYQEGQPAHYTHSYHCNKLLQAKRVFNQHARGPAVEKYLSQLEANCEKYWKNGRQLCEEISLTGNHCVKELHRLEDSLETDANKGLPIMPHTSKVQMKSSCNCGRKQGEREDPFDHKGANHEYYDKLAKDCCSALDSIKLPVFEPSTSDIRAASKRDSGVSLDTAVLKRDGSKFDVFQGMASLSLALSLGQHAGSDLYPGSGHQSYNPDDVNQTSAGSQEQAGTVEADDSAIVTAVASLSHLTKPIRQHSTTEYLPGMIQSESPGGLLPKFPSWSLISLGKYTNYSPQTGFDYSGFLHGSNLLLPWDITLKGDKAKWLAEKKGPKFRKGQREGEFSVRVYLGYEFECPCGHRFFCSGPDKMLKLPPTGMYKENAYRIVNTDMPLYFPCHCRTTKGYYAQLMRCYISIPEGPIEVGLNPRVLPGPAPCPVFYPGNEGPIPLRSGELWVLRLPFTYLGEKGPYLMPTDPQQLSACRLLKGLFQFMEVTD